MHLAAAELLGRDHLAGGGLHQRRAAQEDRALAADDHRLVAHRGDVGAARRAGAEDGGDLRDAARGQGGLVEEDPPEVVAVGEDLVLLRQEGAAGVDQVDAGQPVVQGDLLGAQVLLDRHRVVRAALDGGVVGDDHDLAAGDPADPGDDAGGRGLAVVHAVGGQRGELQEGRSGVEQPVHAVAGSSLPRAVCRARAFSPPPSAAAAASRAAARTARRAPSRWRGRPRSPDPRRWRGRVLPCHGPPEELAVVNVLSTTLAVVNTAV